jgi:hypothetical protein
VPRFVTSLSMTIDRQTGLSGLDIIMSRDPGGTGGERPLCFVVVTMGVRFPKIARIIRFLAGV